MTTKYDVQYTAQFKRDLKKAIKQGCNIIKMKEVIAVLADGGQLPEKNRDHPLSGEWKGFRECHIQPDWLLIYKYYEDSLILSLTRTGSHSYLELE